jgi:hypothetical protein
MARSAEVLSGHSGLTESSTRDGETGLSDVFEERVSD